LLKYYISFLTNEDAVLRQRTISACIKLEAIAKPALKNLMIIATNDSDRGIRLAAVRAIGSMGPSANEAIPLLSSLTNSEEKQISLKALHAISPQHH
jgi:HEAT repeat protein